MVKWIDSGFDGAQEKERRKYVVLPKTIERRDFSFSYVLLTGEMVRSRRQGSDRLLQAKPSLLGVWLIPDTKEGVLESKL